MKRELILVIILGLGFTSCLRLDDQLFNNKKIAAYAFESYTGTRELADLNGQYLIPDSLIHPITFKSSSSDGEATIYGVYIGAIDRVSTDTVILYCHGNAHHMDMYWSRAKLLSKIVPNHRFGVLMFDYRGYGKSTGKPSEENLYADTDAALQWLASRGLQSERLIVYGYSLGSAPACEISLGKKILTPAKIILEAPFASSQVMINDASGLALPGSYFTNYKINNADKIRSINQPFMWLHGTKDDFLSIKTHGEVVFKNYKGTKGVAVRVDEAVHNNLPSVMGYTAYLEKLRMFIIGN